jgi:hypothetical protein
MPPITGIGSGKIPEATKRRLEQKYHPAQPLQDGHISSQRSNSDTQIIPPGPPPGPAPIANMGHQAPRSLPNRAVTDENFDDAYVSFIMYCNPSVALDADTAELRKIFRAPPKSDGNMFSTFTLFELIKKLEHKAIKTWAQLVIILGVEPPALDKGQSAQKVQQYAVRLKVSYLCLHSFIFSCSNTSIVGLLFPNFPQHGLSQANILQRWMHAMHVDAFFEYLLEKSHVYWTQVPSVEDPASSVGRDGVAPEEDLALRALLPETRPKRGRRRAEDRDDDSDGGKSPSQRRRVDSPTLSEDFMIARASLVTEHDDQRFHQTFNDRIVPWSATDTRPPQLSDSFRWAPPDDAQTPMSAYPQSAVTPSSTGRNVWNDGSRSAITPSKSRSRRRHGPAVSSAWPMNGATASGKLRGRPPSNRSVTDGPFSTFPANPSTRDVPTISLRDNTPAATPVAANSNTSHFFPPELRINAPKAPIQQEQNGRPGRLHLQVPERQGGSVRLATPPAVVFLNGDGNANLQNDPISQPQHFTPMMEYFNTPSTGDPESGFNHFVSIAFWQNEIADRTNVDALESHFISEILGADWYDAGGAIIARCSIDEADKICKQVIKNLQAESSSTVAFLINLSALAGGPLMTRMRIARLHLGMKTDYECHWKMKFGSIEGEFTIKATVQQEDEAPKATGNDTETTWKQRYLDLQQQIRERDEKARKLKRGVLDALVVTNHYNSI